MQKVASFILKLIDENVEFTDMQIKEGQALAYRTPVKYEKTDLIPTYDDMVAFAKLAGDNWSERIKEGKGQFNAAFNIGGKVKLRCNIFFEGINNKLSVALRRIPLNIKSTAELGIPIELQNLITGNMQGLVLITGPTGAGKTTTQFSIAEELNKNWPMHIISLESPIEYELESKMSIITQREIPTNVESYEKAIEAARRQRPELIIIGEVINKETVDALFKAAETGHLVLAGTHANSAEDAIEAMLSGFTGNELEQKRIQLSKTLLGINSQRLLPSLDGKSNVLAYDLLIPSDIVRANIRNGDIKSVRNNILSGNRNGSKLFNEVLAELVFKKKIAEKTALKATTNEDEYFKALNALIKKL